MGAGPHPQTIGLRVVEVGQTVSKGHPCNWTTESHPNTKG